MIFQLFRRPIKVGDLIVTDGGKHVNEVYLWSSPSEGAAELCAVTAKSVGVVVQLSNESWGSGVGLKVLFDGTAGWLSSEYVRHAQSH